MPKFLIVRYAPGSGGKFLSCCLQLSSSVNCWDPELEQLKSSNPELVVGWFQNHFTRDWVNYLKLEPEVPYKLGFISNRFNRGNDIDFDTLIANVKQSNDQYFLDHCYNNKSTVLILNKSAIPAAFVNQCTLINMIINDSVANSWVNRSICRKLYFEKEPGLFIIKQDHPEYCSAKRSKLAQQYNNVREIQMSKYAFIKTYILNNPETKLFTDIKSITQDSSNNNQPQCTFDVSVLSNADLLYQSLVKLFADLQLEAPGKTMLKNLCNFYATVNR
jgi:hypothetical protein